MKFIEGVVTLISLMPALKRAFDQLVKVYLERERERLKQENKDAVEKTMATQDQRAVEKVLNTPSAGQPSGHEGSEFRDRLPGVTP